MSKMPYFDREYMSYVYEQHLFQPPFSFFEDRIDNSELRSIFLLWLAELSILPCVRLNHLTHLLLWERDTLNAFRIFPLPILFSRQIWHGKKYFYLPSNKLILQFITRH